MTTHISLLFAGLCALLQCFLTALVIVRRAQIGVNLQDGGDALLLRRIRAHGNFAETVPLALLLMALLEYRGLASIWLWSLGGLLLLGRLFHAFGMLGSRSDKGSTAGAVPQPTLGVMWSRLLGMVLTITVLSVAGLLSIWMTFR